MAGKAQAKLIKSSFPHGMETVLKVKFFACYSDFERSEEVASLFRVPLRFLSKAANLEQY